MDFFYSATTGGFYDSAPLPDDAVAITAEEYQWLFAQQAAGKVIVTDATGHPIAVDEPTPPLDQVKAALCIGIDSAADATYAAIGGDSPGRMAEYQQAKADADAFKAADYTGDVPPTVACWAQATGWSAQRACDDILATAAQWVGALVAIRSARLIGKSGVQAASDAASAQAVADEAVASIRAITAG